MIDKLNCGCGSKREEGYLNVDEVNLPGVDRVMNLEVFPYNFNNGFFSEIKAVNVIEHLGCDLDTLFKEFHRILKPGGKLIIRVPHYTNTAAHYTQHKNIFSSRSFDGYIKGSTFNTVYDFGFKSIKKTINFTKGLQYWNHIIEFIANRNIQRYYEDTFLSAFPAKGIWYTIEK